MYTALDSSRREVRLLRLLAGSQADGINCELYTTSLSNPDDYEALSYVWGSASNPRPITIKGNVVSVTKNLETALRHIRYPDRPRTLWVDAVCINQQNIQERNHQVRSMGDIYSTASQVLVWLGPSGENEFKAIDMIERHAADSELHWPAEENDVSFIRLFVFLNNEWWSRIWTVQEAVLARRIIYQCGHRELPDSVMLSMSHNFRKHTTSVRCCTVKQGHFLVSAHADLATAMNRVQDLDNFQEQARKGNLPFDEVASQFRTRNATDPRDKVYGLLGISQGVSTASIDYSLSPVQVFDSTTREFLDYRKNLDLLSHCTGLVKSRRTTTTAGLPSWVPDWGAADPNLTSDGDVYLIAFRTAMLDAYNACGQLGYTPSDASEEGTLCVPGIFCDRIERVGSHIRDRALLLSPKTIFEWRSMTSIDQDPSQPYRGGDAISDAFWRTLCLDIDAGSALEMNPASKTKRAKPEHESIYMGFWYRELLAHYKFPQPDGVRDLSEIDTFNAHISRATARRRFFVSREGFIGLGPPGTKVGDKICVLAGGKVPFILRDLEGDERGDNESKPGTYCRLLGDAYVHGLMDGQAVKMVEDGTRELETFKLR